MGQGIIIVNASDLLRDVDVMDVITAIDVQYKRDFKPAWGSMVPDVDFTFAPMSKIGALPVSAWPIFLNKHSQEPGALGWHTQEGQKIYGRVYVGDCFRFGLKWSTDLGHEVYETALNPNVDRVWRAPNGDLYPLEACDAVESDDFAYDVFLSNGKPVSCTDFVYPDYFSIKRGPGVRFDHGGHLVAGCPALTAGGYMSVQRHGQNSWTTLQMDRQDGLIGRRLMMANRRRRAFIQHLSPVAMKMVDPLTGFVGL